VISGYLRDTKSEHSDNLPDRTVGHFVLPYPYDFPSCCPEELIGLSVPFDGSGEFLLQPRSIGFRLGTVSGAMVPEAAVNENCYVRLCEHNVCAPPYSGNRCVVDSVSKAPSPELSPKSHFWRSVAHALHLHS
jgi:hypothetical protein